MSLRWLGRPGVDAREADGAIGFRAGPTTDWFHDPRSGTVTTAAPVAIVSSGAVPVTVSCHVVAELVSTFDAAGLFVYYDDELRRSGLGNLAERAALVGGTFTAESRPEGGTELVWAAPLEQP